MGGPGAARLAAQLGIPVDHPRIQNLTLPIFDFAKNRHREENRPIALGLSAPQGCGKTTLSKLLEQIFVHEGLTCAVISFDDFYLTGEEQDVLAKENPHNPLLQVRGNAGTHDMRLGTETLTALLGGKPGVKLPRYDKSARAGRGDRAPVNLWPALEKPPDIVILEGWMAGFAPLDESDPLLSQEDGIRYVNQRLASYDAWYSLLSGWVVIGVDDVGHVYKWRLEAERAMVASGKPGMDDAAVSDFVDRYMPAYRTYLPGLYRSARGVGVGGLPTLFIEVGSDRLPTGGTC